MAVDIAPEKFISEVSYINQKVFEEMLTEELGAIKAKHMDKDTKLRVASKEDIKEEIARSPDFSDTAMMRARFEYKTTLKTKGVKVNIPLFKSYGKREAVKKAGIGIRVNIPTIKR